MAASTTIEVMHVRYLLVPHLGQGCSRRGGRPGLGDGHNMGMANRQSLDAARLASSDCGSDVAPRAADGRATGETGGPTPECWEMGRRSSGERCDIDADRVTGQQLGCVYSVHYNRQLNVERAEIRYRETGLDRTSIPFPCW